jgi:hypothetical protein
MSHIKYIQAIALLTFAGLILSGCGIKPGKLVPPTPENDAPFPAQYPHS